MKDNNQLTKAVYDLTKTVEKQQQSINELYETLAFLTGYSIEQENLLNEIARKVIAVE